MTRNNMKLIAILAMPILFSLVVYSQQHKNGFDKPLVIQSQGSFTIGGTVIQNPGNYDATKFDNWKPYPEGQTYHGDIS